MAAQYPGAVPTFTGSTETAPATTSPTGLADWATKVKDEIVAIATLGVGPRVTYESGLWYTQEMRTIGNTTQATGTLTLSRYDFPPGTTIVQLGEWVNTVGGAGALRRLCIYNDNGNGYPGSLLKDGGTYAADVGSGVFGSVTAFTAVDVSGVKWLGGVSTVATANIISNSMPSRAMGLATVTGGNLVWAGWSQTGVTGALPDPFTTTRTTNTQAPSVFFKVG